MARRHAGDDLTWSRGDARWDWPADVVALGVINSEPGDHPLGLLVGDELGDRFLAETLGDADHRFDYKLVDVSGDRVLDEFAVDLDVVERQVPVTSTIVNPTAEK